MFRLTEAPVQEQSIVIDPVGGQIAGVPASQGRNSLL
jgi:hypothetical protein